MGSLGMRQIQVRATNDPTAKDGVRFELHEGSAKVPDDTLESAKTKNDSKHNDYHEFTFRLHETDVDLLFQDPPNAALTTSNGDIEPVRFVGNRKALEVRNWNRDKSDSKFDLNFVKSDGTAVVFDPIWANQNGGV